MRRDLAVEPIRALLDPDTLEELRERLGRGRLLPAGAEGWERGMPRLWLAELLADWAAFDVAGFQARLDELTHLRAHVGGLPVHLVHAPGRGPDPLPLLLTHGWPGSFCEYLRLLPLLTDPAADGGDPADAFTVVVPSLPGFGFSAPPPPGGLTAEAVAGLWHQIMTEGLGYPRYAAHGSDLGAGVTARLARGYPGAVAGIHLATPGLPAPPLPWTPAEQAYVAEAQAWTAEEGGYAHEQATKPATLGAALHDSPAGLAAWIGEKIVAWSSTAGRGQPAFGRDLLLGTLTLYWATGTAASSLLPYWAARHTPGSALPAGDPPPVPTAVSVFGGERVPFPKPPRELAERFFTLTGWQEHDRGGHFPAVAEPRLLAEILRDTFRPLRELCQAASQPHSLIGWMLVAEIRVYPALKLMACGEPPDILGDTGGEERLGHLLGVGGVRGDQAVREIPQRMARGQRLGISHVQGRAADLVRAQRLHQRRGIDQRAPGHVDQPSVLVHYLEFLLSDHPAALGGEREREHDRSGTGQRLAQVRGRHRPDGARDRFGAPADDRHPGAERLKQAQQRDRDTPTAQDGNRLVE